ncbi:helix-turn-helix domain-containing protein [Kineosporia sp. R_H_3]|uniref:helix-turn-helix domain-containing protein n=1 Tax=Kineosporia sp. R_H_3 TaxID=1961848 RepID=UPI000B4AF501|nr:helix-turn-helix domain-containing protein [Kineosporia sp. R_H_3]
MTATTDASTTLADFAADLWSLRTASGVTLREMSSRTHFSLATLCTAARGERLPTWPVASAYLAVCDVAADIIDTEWLPRWEALMRNQADNYAASRLDTTTSIPVTSMGRAPDGATSLPDPEAIRTPEDLSLALKQFKVLAGHPSIDTWSTRLGVSRSRLADAVSGRHVPQWDLLLVVLLEAGATTDDRLPWGLAWQRAWENRRLATA